MRLIARLIGLAFVGVVVLLLVGAVYVRLTGLTAREQPGPLETSVARAARRFAIPASERARMNPVPRSDDAVSAGLDHFADHCAVCHANDGSGETDFGRGMFPKPPDMRAAATQEMTDGELFYVIENGIRFTGMPAFGGQPEGETSSWQLVHFIRRLPALSQAELDRMATLNPRPPGDVRREIEEEQFLRGDTP
jgi:mono/diheme cytochrome c family protein